MKKITIKNCAIFCLSIVLLINVTNMATFFVEATPNFDDLIGSKITTIYGDALKGSDGQVYYEKGFTAVNFNTNGTYTTNKTSSFQLRELIGIDSSGNQSWLYCVEYNTKFSRNGYSSSNIENNNYLMMNASRGTLAKGLNKLAKDKNISGLDGIEAIRNICTATIYGWQPDAVMPAELSVKGLNAWDWYYGTQIVIWEYQQGIRQSPTQCTGNGYNSGTVLYNWIKGRPAAYAYEYINRMMAQHNVIPSFSTKLKASAPTYTLTWNSANQRYETTLTDTNGYAFNLQFPDSNIHIEKSGSKYTIWTTKTITSAVTCKVSKDIHISENQKLLVWGTGGKQTMISGMQDPVDFYLKLKTDKPTITIEKTGTTSADIANRVFYVYQGYSAAACLILTTDVNGKASGYLPGEGTYCIEEQDVSEYNVTYTINGADTQTFTYPGSAFDSNNNVTVKVNNEQKTGYLQIKKESEDGKIQGLKFQIQGNGTDIIGTTDENGYVTYNGSYKIPLLPGIYTVTEVDTPERYETADPVTVTITADQTVIRTITNTLRPAYLKLIKESADGVVAGVQFGITGTTATGKHVDMIVVTGTDGTILTEMEQGTYTVSEINVPGKYYTPSSQTVVLNNNMVKSLTFTNQLKPSYLQIKKESEDGIVSGMKFRVQSVGGSDPLDITGYTNQDGYVVFGEKAYLVEVAGTNVSGCYKYAVVDKDATVAQILSDLGLDDSQYYISSSASGINFSSGQVVATTDSSGFAIPYGSYRYIFKKGSSSPYAQIVFRGSIYYGNASSVMYYGVTSYDLNYASARIGQTVTDKSYPESLYMAAYDVDRDGILTRADYDILSKSNTEKKDVTGSSVLTVTEGKYRITELEVPERYTAGFDQIITVDGEETKIVRVTNLLKTSGVKIVKSSEDGAIAGIQFRITGTTTTGASVNMTVTTDENGMIAQKLNYGTYTITEVAVADRYITPTSKTVTLTEQNYETVTFENKLKDGRLELVKTSEDGVVSGVSFRIQSITTTNGSVIDKTIKTDENGRISLSLPQGTYLLTESDTADRYITPISQTVTLTAGKTSTVTFQNLLKVPTLKIIKTSEDGKVEGVQFRVTGTTIAGQVYDEIFITDSNGLISKSIPQGTYTVTEIQTDDRYEEQGAKTVTLNNDEVKTISFRNILKEGSLKIVKTSEDGIVAGIKFIITGKGEDGVIINKTIVTDADGTFSISLKPGAYNVYEAQQDERYVIQEMQEVTVQYGQTAEVIFQNKLKKFQLTLIKKDGSSQQGLPQGEGTLEGAVYGVYREDGSLIAKYMTDKNGRLTTDVIPCQAAYVQEITPPKGYRLDEDQYTLESSLEDCFLELTALTLEVTDYPIVGNISILKKMGTEEKWEYESGAVFEVYLKSAGSYEAANEWERDLITTDEALDAENSNTGQATTGGEAGTKDLPTGTYIVHQVSGTEGFLLAEDIEVVIDDDHTVIQLEILNWAEEELPFTGRKGAETFIIVGIIFMLTACTAALAGKKASACLYDTENIKNGGKKS